VASYICEEIGRRLEGVRVSPFLIVFAGINGTGKTTTIAKMAKFLTKKGFSVVLACSDTYRAGSIEQLDEHARRLGVRMIKHQYGSDPAAVAYDSKSHAKLLTLI